MDFPITRHIAAISPYFNILQQPAVPFSRQISSAVYLFRHGIIHVNGHDYHSAIVPFLQKLRSYQRGGHPFVKSKLAFLSSYSSWITSNEVGKVSSKGLQQCRELGHASKIRYSAWYPHDNGQMSASLKLWTDGAARCRLSARAFGEGFKGESNMDIQVNTIYSGKSKDPCDNLCWHQRFPEINQQAGAKEAEEFLGVYTTSILDSLKPFFENNFSLSPKDVYAMQLLCCYDLVAGRESSFSDVFRDEDWLSFEYMRDVKYHYSEGHGAAHAGEYATPWLESAIKLLQTIPESGPLAKRHRLPLWISFTHREEILYLAVLLGLGWDGPGNPSTKQINESRRWRVTHLAPYLGHIGLESFKGSKGQDLLRIIVNGEVAPAFKGELPEVDDGGYDCAHVEKWLSSRAEIWAKFKGGSVQFYELDVDYDSERI
ncbi:MAG: hypothetical protein M1827_007225 [Pycnora praestabilis]|nr:MAG: hypothetical protein M1827_007225 [Pycnora praestabilis]